MSASCKRCAKSSQGLPLKLESALLRLPVVQHYREQCSVYYKWQQSEYWIKSDYTINRKLLVLIYDMCGPLDLQWDPSQPFSVINSTIWLLRITILPCNQKNLATDSISQLGWLTSRRWVGWLVGPVSAQAGKFSESLITTDVLEIQV